MSNVWLNLHSFPRRQLPLKNLSHIFVRLPLLSPGPPELDCPGPEADDFESEPVLLPPL